MLDMFKGNIEMIIICPKWILELIIVFLLRAKEIEKHYIEASSIDYIFWRPRTQLRISIARIQMFFNR